MENASSCPLERLSYHPIDGKQLVASFQSALAVSHAPWNHSGDVDRRVLLLSSHDVEAQAFVRLWELYDTWVGVAFTCRERRYGRLGAKRREEGENEMETETETC